MVPLDSPGVLGRVRKVRGELFLTLLYWSFSVEAFLSLSGLILFT